MTRRKRVPAPKRKFSLWVSEAEVDRMKQVAQEMSLAEGRHVTASELIRAAMKRSYRRGRKSA